MSAIDRRCAQCGCALVWRNKRFCSGDCRTTYYRNKDNRQQYIKTAAENRTKLTGPLKPGYWEPRKKYVSPISDKEQYRLNRMIDGKHDAPLHFKHYKPGTPEFERVAAQCTPPDRIPVESYALFGIPDPGGRLFDERK